MEITIKQRLKDLIRPLSMEEQTGLETDILRDGCLEPLSIWRHDGQNILLDGHNRYRICNKHNIRFETAVIKSVTIDKEILPLDSIERAEIWVGQHQKNKRNMESSDFTSLAGKLVPSFSVEAARRQKELAGTRPNSDSTLGKKLPKVSQVDENKRDEGKAVAQAAKAVGGTNRTYVAAAVKAAGYDSKTQTFKKPEVLNKIGSGVGQTKIKDVMKEQRKESHDRALTAARKATENAEKTWIITDKQDVLSCASLITDPPYGILDEEWEPRKLQNFTRDWLSRWNKSGAKSILSFWSQEHLWDGKAWFDDELSRYEFRQLLIWRFKNNNKPQSRDYFKRSWEPVFFYVLKGAKCQPSPGGLEWGDDTHNFDSHEAAVPQSNFNAADFKQHAAQKPVSVMRWLVSAVTKPGDLVIDPFAGSGTTGIAAVQLGRQFHGIEIDEKFRKLAEGRIAQYGKKEK
jgi:DNA modification methylase